MKILVLNGSPRKNGTVASLLRAVADGLDSEHHVDWIDVYDLNMQPCMACMKCRPDGECCLKEDDAHRLGRMIREADGLIIGTPTYWGNMSAPLKLLFDRNVTAFFSQRSNGLPIPHHKGKPAAIVTACTWPWPLNFILAESRGAIRAVRKVLSYGGYKILGTLAKPGTHHHPEISPRLLKKAKSLGSRF
jgi:NAD(P)H-dependent FMN reductase